MEFLGSTQTEQLKAIGTKLSEARQQQSMSLEEIAAKTYIPLRLLNAIEAGKLEQLPEPVFIQGFIRRYADALGLDGTTLSKGFSLQAPAVAPSAIATPVVETPAVADSPKTFVTAAPVPPRTELRPVVMATPKSATYDADSELDREESSFKLPWVPIAAAIGLGLFAWLIGSALNKPKVEMAKQPAPAAVAPKASSGNSTPVKSTQPASFSSPTVAASVNPSVSPAASPVASVSPSPVASASPSPSASPSASPIATGSVQVKMNVTDESWVEVFVDGESVFEGTLPKGTQKSFSGKKQVEISSGNAGGVSVSYNNGAAKAIGALGDVATGKYPPTP